MPMWLLTILSCVGVLLYCGVGIATLIYGGNFLEYGVLSSIPSSGNHIGILIIEIGVGIAVAPVILLIFFSLAGRR